jgi:hypothetical protein
MKLGVIVPVSDVDRAERYYGGLGWRPDAGFGDGRDFRVVQLTPPGLQCSIHFGKGLTTAELGSAQSLCLVVQDVEAARSELIGHGAEVSEAFHHSAKRRLQRGPDPERRSHRAFATLRDPDGNGWLLQEIKERLPGRAWPGPLTDVATLTELLRGAENRHGQYEPTAPKHHWSGWYAAFIVAREEGRAPDEAAKEAALHVERTRN